MKKFLSFVVLLLSFSYQAMAGVGIQQIVGKVGNIVDNTDAITKWLGITNVYQVTIISLYNAGITCTISPIDLSYPSVTTLLTMARYAKGNVNMVCFDGIIQTVQTAD